VPNASTRWLDAYFWPLSLCRRTVWLAWAARWPIVSARPRHQTRRLNYQEELMSKKTFRKLAVSFAVAGVFATHAYAQDTIRIGGLATLDGPFAVLGQEAFRAMELAFEEVGYEVDGKKIEWVKESSDGRPDVALT